MQISHQEVDRVLRTTQAKSAREAQPVGSVEELAARHGVSMDEVRQVTERLRMAEEDPAREKRLKELQRRVAGGEYRVEADQVVEMAERRAIADRSGQF
jgi:anti-sigma28 factor (negative regulator of flagellin synthesis)